MELWQRTPLWALRILVSELPAIEAERTRSAAQAAAFPHLKDGDRRGLVHAWAAATRPRGTRPAPDTTTTTPAEPVSRDAEAAAAYFASMGARVVRPE